MTPDGIPLVDAVIEAGPDNSMFDLLLLAGPVIIVLLAIAGRSPVTVAIGVLYVVGLVGTVLYQAVSDVPK